MNGIDISNWQRGINLATVPCDFVIAKATQGTGYTSPSLKDQMEQAISLGKLVGAYHYIDGSGARQEAAHFVNAVKPYIGRAILAADWENGDNRAWGNEGYLREFVQAVREMSGVVPFIYASKSPFPWNLAAEGYPKWVAQYADMNPTGYQANPWNEGAYDCAIRQYSSAGRLNGYGGNLDLDKAYITREQWMAYAAVNGNASPAPSPTPTDSSIEAMDVTDIVAGVMRGEYGDGDDRKAKLGSRYQEAQDLINHIANAPVETLVAEVWADRYGNGSKRQAILGNRYQEVQAAINGSRIHTVKAGETLSGIAAQYETTYQELAAKNGIANPNIIYVGQRINV